jgi:hypothetical protein
VIATAFTKAAGSYFGTMWTVLPPIRVPARMIEKPTMCDIGSTP